MSDTGIYEGRVRIFGGMHEEGEELRKVKITTLGDTVRLAKWSEERQLFREVDMLDDVKVTGKGGEVHFTGLSRQLRDEVQLADADREVRWELRPRGCTTCR